MRILLRVLVVFLLLLSIAALVFGIVLFSQREQLKARTNRLEDEIITLATQVEIESFDDLARRRARTGGISKNDLKRYYKLDPTTGKRATQINPAGKTEYITKGQGTMDQPLLDLQDRARKQLTRIDKTRMELTTTRDDLAASRAAHRRTSASLAAANEMNLNLQATINEQDTQIIEREVQIETKDAVILDLNNQIENKDVEIARLKETILERDHHVIDLKRYIDELDAKILIYTQGQENRDPTITEGYKGNVLKVNPKYNFIVIDTEPSKDPRLATGSELIVQRNSVFVGKVKVLQVKSEEHVAIAQIMPDWLQMPIQKGDRVVFERMMMQ